jgi:hypothetical protein
MRQWEGKSENFGDFRTTFGDCGIGYDKSSPFMAIAASIAKNPRRLW